MAEMYYDKDADLEVLEGKKVAIIGYGIQGRGQGLNLRDSGINVAVADLPDSPNWKQAAEDGFTPVSTEEAVKDAGVVQILTQDDVQAKVYDAQVKNNLKNGAALMFSHGFNIHFEQIVPSDDIDVVMVAPKGPGSLVRQMYEEGKGVPCLLAIHQDATGNAKAVGLAYAKAVGGTRAGVLKTTFKEETETDLFGEQTVLCGGVTELIKAGFDTLVDAGYKPEVAYFECLHELKLITDMINVAGIQGMRARVSDTAEFGDLTRGERVIGKEAREEMKKILAEVQSGEFAKEWIEENKAGRPKFNELRKRDENHPIEVVGKQLRSMMPWME
jgi:ketol-acid reductoisomerase